jgi:hypothetical protein
VNPPRRTRSPLTGRRSCGIGGLVAVGAGLAVFLFTFLAAGVSPAAAQLPLEEAEARYEEALAAYEEIRRVRDQALNRHEILIDRQEDARRAGDEEAAREAMSRVHSQGVQVMQLDQQLRAAVSVLQDAARDYLAALEAREDELLDRIEATFLPTTRARLDRELSETRARYRQVEREAGAPTLGQLRPLPDVVIRRGDGPEELRGKAGILESRAEEYDSVITSLQREIASRERRMQLQRGQEDLLAGISRFDDDAFTGRGLAPPADDDGGDAEVRPGVPVNLAELPLAEQVSLLREYLGLAQEMRDEALARARVFRARAEGGNP